MEPDITSDVLEVPDLSNPKIYVNGNLQNSRTVDEGSPLLLACNVEGNPIPEIILRKLTGNEILGQHKSTWLNHTMIGDAKCSDTSTYSCEGSSSEFDRKYQSFNISVLCDPRLDKSTVVIINYRSMNGPDVNVPVTVPVIANPTISLSGITWSGPSARSILTNIDSQRDSLIYKQMIRSIIPIPDQRTFGNYSLMYNGKTIIDITINAKDKPQPPLNFTGYSYASGYVNLTWISNFNGGPDQVFTLYRLEGSSWRLIKNLTDPGEGKVGFFDPGLLNTGQVYWFQLESCNKISCSWPVVVKVTVRGVISHLRESSTQTTWIVVGVLIGLSILLLTHFGVYKFAFYRAMRSGLNQTPQPSINLKIMNKEYDDVDDVTVEAQDQSPNTQTYEDITENTEQIQPLTDYQNIIGHQDNQYEELKPDQDRLYSSLKVQ